MHRAACLVLLACRPDVELPDVPIVGGTDAQREAARDELLAFDAAVGPGRLRIEVVVFEPLKGMIGQAGQGRIRLESGLDVDAIGLVLRHELCHALDASEDLLRDPDPLFDAYGEWLVEIGKGPARGSDSARRRRSEALAVLCETEAFGSRALATSCPGESDLLTDLSVWMSDRVWSAYEPPDPWPALGDPEVTYEGGPMVDIHGPWTGLGVRPTEDPTVVVVYRNWDDLGTRSWADLYTGERLLTQGPEPVEDEHPPGHPGPAATVDYLAVDIDGSRIYRLFAVKDGHRGLVGDGCVKKPGNAFTADGRAWFAGGDGTRVWWTEVP